MPSDAGWLLIDASAPGAVVEPLAANDFSRPLARIRLESAAARVLDVPTRRVEDLAATLFAAEAAGVARWACDTAVDYAKVRTQFGSAIGSFQAVKHHLADVAIALEMARPLVHAAALGADGMVPANTNVLADISAAKVAAADAAYLASRQALQVLGAIGYTAEHDLSLYLTKTRALVGAWGTPAQHRQRILNSL